MWKLAKLKPQHDYEHFVKNMTNIICMTANIDKTLAKAPTHGSSFNGFVLRNFEKLSSRVWPILFQRERQRFQSHLTFVSVRSWFLPLFKIPRLPRLPGARDSFSPRLRWVSLPWSSHEFPLLPRTFWNINFQPLSLDAISQ